MTDTILIRGARLHNLKNISLNIPKNKLVVFTGLSGSGKSSLAFDILHKEGARQYMESLGMVTDGMSKAPVDELRGLSPSISVDQHLTNRSPRSTVGTSTEVFTYLRVLFARLGHRPCRTCGEDVPPSTEAMGDMFGEEETDPQDEESVHCPHCGAALPELSMTHFSFNKPAGACPTCTGLGVTAELQMDRIFDPSLSVLDGGVRIWDQFNTDRFAVTLQRAGRHYGFVFDPHQPLSRLGEVQHDLLYYGVNSESFKQHYPNSKAPSSVVKGNFEGVITNLKRRYAEGLSESGLSAKMDDLFAKQICSDCGGARLRLESRQVTVAGRGIIELSQLPLQDLSVWLATLPPTLSDAERSIAEPVLADLEGRIQRLVNIGVGYLSMERSTPSLSAGEAQRLRLASLLGSGLSGVLYVLDEPTIGLHQRDTGRLIGILRQLRDLGNTVLVIEHDLEMIRAADYVVEFGPGAGKHGGQIVVCGTPSEVAACSSSPTGAFLSGSSSLPHRPRLLSQGELIIYNAREHNLQGITVSIPLRRLVAVTGVSGSGKSSLIFDVLDRAASQRFNNTGEGPGAHDKIEGWEQIERVVTVDQGQIGRIPRSNAATYTETFSAIREVFAAQESARASGFTARHFSFNISGGRCERCEGAGALNVNMHFLPDVQVRCPVCRGKRFKKDVLAVKYRGANVADVLDLTINEALALFADVPEVAARLDLMAEVGMGYLQLGQPTNTLSGGEAQRVKLAKELARRGNGRALYLLDEPTTGLHPADVARLLSLLRRLVDSGHSVVVVEHHLELISACDWVIDLGPEGGQAGGQLIAAGTPEQIAQIDCSHTGRCLKHILSN